MATDTNSITISGNITRDPGDALHAERRLEGHLRRRGEPLVAQPADPGVGRADQLLQRRRWRQLAENVGASLAKGSRVVVSGRLEQRSWETEQGEKRSIVEIVADDVAPSLRFATAEVHKVERSGPGDGGGGPPRRPAPAAAAAAPAADGNYDDYGEEPF